MTEKRPGEPIDERLERLEERLKAHQKAERARAERPRSSSTGYALAVRLGSEFIAAVLVGAGIGWSFDRFAGTAPFGMIVFLLLGFAAGVLNVLRAQGVVAEAGDQLRQRRDPGPGEGPGDGGPDQRAG
ncbi:AtpZ/AtpI family protein [Prosthecomicrobium sp. N25]|uniref:AtpZ/AtpI family protein n=1 Tax=Prosthecomicrobium sp. N25 TaxID=3129254 RepID=UPI0030778ED4